MSNADPEEVSVAVEQHGVSVEKSFEPDDFPVPAIAFVIRSTREVPVEVRLTDSVPDDIEAEDIGFHPKYGADHWTNEDGRLVFEREFEAGEEYTTVYGLRSRDTDSVERFLGDPALESVDPESDEDPGRVVSDVMNEGETLELRDPNEKGGEASDDDLEAAIAAADVSGSNDLAAAVDAAEQDPGSDPDIDTERAPSGEVDVVAALAAELRAGNVSQQDLNTLQDALGANTDGSVDARINHLQSEVGDLKAYTVALEEFLDENGEAQTLLRNVQESIEGLESSLSTVRSNAQNASTVASEASAEVDAIAEEFSALQSEVQSLDDRFGNVNEDLTDVRNSVKSNSSELNSIRDDVDVVSRDVESTNEEINELYGEIEGVTEDVDSIRGEVSSVEEEVSAVHGDVEGVAGDVDSVREDVAEFSGELESVREEVESVREDIPDGELDGLDERVSDIDGRIADLEAEIEGLAQMREQMASVFGGAGGPPAQPDPDDAE